MDRTSTATLQRRYRRARAEDPYLPARYALSVARATDDALANGHREERDGWTLTLELEDDPHGWSWVGAEFEHDGATYYSPTDPPYGEDEAYAELRRAGASRSVASELAAERARRWRHYVVHDLYAMVATVTAAREGVELGSASLGSVDLEFGTDMPREYFDDLAGEALEEARATLARLCPAV